ncbi:hypothetical protein LS684_07240 [Cytobacillus spongiae]|nr:hypothetical protein [Cytobacillus spongiae]UII58019.1 hypothetical protein LS684_07240 [Cytobacillus spongiae]
MMPIVKCPRCESEEEIVEVLTAQSNQNVIYRCKVCLFVQKDIHTSKG